MQADCFLSSLNAELFTEILERKQGFVERVRHLLRRGANANAIDSDSVSRYIFIFSLLKWA
jgi:hypothetical protein